MREFNQLCKEVELLNPLDYGTILTTKAMTIIPALNDIAEDEFTGTSLVAAFILGSIIADGKIDESEYLLLYPMLQTFFGDSVNYDDIKSLAKVFRKENKDLKKYLDMVVDVLSLLSEELKEDIITVCLLICAIDGKISFKEKQWIKQLIR